jgi:hypothetical protein
MRFVVDKVALGQVSLQYFGFPVSTIPPMLHTRSFIDVLLLSETFQKSISFQKSVSFGYKSIFTLQKGQRNMY